MKKLKNLSRRHLIAVLAFLGGGAVLTLWRRLLFVPGPDKSKVVGSEVNVTSHQVFPLDFQWPTQEPFLFCVHHLDLYPKGDSQFAPPRSSLVGRDIGQDFTAKDGFRMYHGETVPGFPVHPHRGFETVTIVRKGYVDHADSLGAAGRYGEGDVQWMTAGRGIQHSEMFPLLKPNSDNTLELFQIWLNLPRTSKMVAPHFKMLWNEQVPRVSVEGDRVQITLIAGGFEGTAPPAPPPDSWAAKPDNDVKIWILRIAEGTEFTMPPAKEGTRRTLYFFEGDGLSVDGQTLTSKSGVALAGTAPVRLKSGSTPVEILWLQAKAIGESVVQHGPFVMNSRAEIVQTIEDYQKTQFGGWPWNRHDMVHGAEIRRFAKYPDGRIETPS